MPDVFGLAAIVTKFGLYLGVMAAAGTVLATVLFRLDATRSLATGFAVLGLGATILTFLLHGANLTGDLRGMVDPEMLGLLWGTPVGTALLLRLVGLGLLILGLFTGRTGPLVCVFGSLMSIWSFGHVGHISSQSNGVLDIALMVHLGAVSLWIGILTPLRRLALDATKFATAAEIGHRFGSVATCIVPILIIAGGVMAYSIVGSFTALFGTRYGQMIVVKILLIAIILALAAANKFRFVPRISSGDPSAARHLANSITAEWLIILTVLVVTAVLTTNLNLPS